MNSLASILYSSSSAKTKKSKNLSLQPTFKPASTKQSRCQVGMLFRSSTPKTPLRTRTKTSLAAHPTALSTSSSSTSLSMASPQSPRCSTPLFAKQRRTRPYIACELCRQRAFQSINFEEKKTTKETHVQMKTDQQQSYQHPTNSSAMRRRREKRRSAIDQLLVWII